MQPAQKLFLSPGAPDQISGAGIGLRHKHFNNFTEDKKPDIGWLEVHSENFFNPASAAHRYLESIREHYAISAHGVGLSLGSADGLDKKHLEKLKWLVDYFKPTLISEHISWGRIGKRHSNDLLPLPYTEEALRVLTNNIKHVQDFLGRRILVENPSSYLTFTSSHISEWEFVARTAEESGCGLLLDINNIYVSSVNHGFSAEEYIDSISSDYVSEIHLAGYSVSKIEGKDILVDTHGTKVYEQVWELYEHAIKKLGNVPTLIEWDTDIPELSVLLDEAKKAETIMNKITRKAA